MAGTYHYKIVSGGEGLTASAFGDMAEDMPECTAADMTTLEKKIYDACKEKSGFPSFTFQNSMVTPKVSLWTACIGTAKAGVVVAAGGGGAAAAAPATGGDGGAKPAAAPEPEPEEEEEEMGFDLFD